MIPIKGVKKKRKSKRANTIIHTVAAVINRTGTSEVRAVGN